MGGVSMRKLHFLILGLALLNSCGSSTPEISPIGQHNTANTSADLASAETVSQMIPNLLAFDMIGGLFQSAMTLGEIESDATTTTIFKTSLSASVTTTPIQFDASYSYGGKNGNGKMVLVETGGGDDTYTPDSNSHLYKFNPLGLRFLFYLYHFNNPCLGDIVLHGEIRCDVEGQYTSQNGRFQGTAHCTNGPETKPQTILYITRDTNYNVEMNVTLNIDGSPYNLASYTPSGNIGIDGKSYDISSLVGDYPTCSNTL